MTEPLEPQDLGLSIPLQGVQLIEASAGTGKTFTVATLYARLVIEARLPVSRLLAVTFTVAATKELREALRARLVLARRMLEEPGHGREGEGFASRAAELTDALLRRALRDEDASSVLARVRRAAQEMDLAPIHTIHGFCQRALHDHALQAGQPLAERELVLNEADLRHEVALEFWRRHSREAAGADALLDLWKTPAGLAKNLRDLLALDALLPAPPEASAEDAAAEAELRRAREALAAAFRDHGETARAALRQACEGGEVSATYVKDGAVDPVWAVLQRWAAQPGGRDPAHDNVRWYGAKHLRERTNKKNARKQPGVTPQSPVFDAIDAWLAAGERAARARQAGRVARVHAARDFARARLQALKQARGLLGFDDMIAQVHAALAGERGEAFAQALRGQYALALVDEFQDTDARQWEIFRGIFAPTDAMDEEGPRALVLIGDPKQAIYGFRGGDVATYLAAQSQADGKHTLARNFRSRPRMLEALQALFEGAGPNAFRQPGIAFERVAPGGACRDEFLRLDGEDAPGLFLQALATDAGEHGIDALRAEAARACAFAIHELLRKGEQGRAMLVDQDRVERPVRAGDISVLIARHQDAAPIQQALAALGIPSVSAARQSLYQTDEARELCWLLEALMAPADDARMRATLASPLFGLPAKEIAAFDVDLVAHRHWQDRLQHWAQRARRHGPMAALADICAAQAPRLLTWPDGERRLSNYLQLAESLQAADAVALGLPGLLAELERRIEEADPENDEEQLRLESDAARVRLMTVHVSKGLTLDLVFVPYTATTTPKAHPRQPAMAVTRGPALERIGNLFAKGKDPACVEEAQALQAEHLRLLYVALTRARLATWVGVAEAMPATPLGLLLGAGGATGLREAAGNAVASLSPVAADALQRLPRLALADPAPREAAREPVRVLDRDWWVYSFSQLARESGGVEPRGGADDELEPLLPRSRYVGSRFGSALHQALENVDFAAWRDVAGESPPTGQLEPLVDALDKHGFSQELDRVDGVALLCDLVARTLNAVMPEGARLAWLPPERRLAEMEFHLALAPVQVDAMLALLHAHGFVRGRDGFGNRRRLEGLLTGRIDLVYEHAGRFHVLDYKSNLLPDYGPEAVTRAIAEGEYDLQYLIYTLALHRWLRFRLGASYDPDQHLGGVRYLFCRGLAPGDPARPGVHALRLPTTLVLELDALLGARQGVAA